MQAEPDTSLLFAALDVGSNSVKVTVADFAGGQAALRYEEAAHTRLGEGMQERLLQEAPMQRTLDALTVLAGSARRLPIRDLTAVGTAALREAVNRELFLQRARAQCGLEIRVLSGEEEAALSFLAVRKDPQWRAIPRITVVDIGGGSTEIVEGDAAHVVSRASVPLGAVKLTERFLKSDPPTAGEVRAAEQAAAEAFAKLRLLSDDMAQASGAAGRTDVQVVGVGGTLSNLGRMDRGEDRLRSSGLVHGHALTASAIQEICGRLARHSVAERGALIGLDPQRADIILGGAILLAQALARIDQSSIAVSTRGLRWGVLYDRTAKEPGKPADVNRPES